MEIKPLDILELRGEVKLTAYLQHPLRTNHRRRNFAHAL